MSKEGERVSRELSVILVKPSKYDDDGYVNHHVRGVIPSNTLGSLSALFREACERRGIQLDLQLIDESVRLVRPRVLMKRARVKSVPPLVCLVGVQTNQFPRAVDIARDFRVRGASVIMGGFHISGTLALHGEARELSELWSERISIFSGEAEGRIDEILDDVFGSGLKQIYRTNSFPDLSRAWPIPDAGMDVRGKFALPYVGTIDASRGCVFRCSFCTVINVQGKSMRCREASLIEAHIRRHYPRISYYFFTDDNMARNKQWRELFERLIRLREEGVVINFMMQVDTAAYRLPEFTALAARAGCLQVFVGIESLNEENLAAAGKRQNKTDRFREMVEAWHAQGVSVHAAYIIGFPCDSEESVRCDIDRLVSEVQPDHASFFMLTPLPGSEDHAQMQARGAPMSADFNEYDSFHVTMEHPRMNADQWRRAYEAAWRRFYDDENVISILNRARPDHYWALFKHAIWYCYAVFVERQHPMITGFFRLKGRKWRRPSFPREGVIAYSLRRAGDFWVMALRLGLLTLKFERIWRATWMRRRVDALSEQLCSLREFSTPLRRSTIGFVVGSVTRLMLRLSALQGCWRRALWQLRMGRLLSPELYAASFLGAVGTAVSVATKGWLFLLNAHYET